MHCALVQLFYGSINLKVMTANLYLFNSGIGGCEFIFVFASRKDLSGAGHKGNQNLVSCHQVYLLCQPMQAKATASVDVRENCGRKPSS